MSKKLLSKRPLTTNVFGINETNCARLVRVAARVIDLEAYGPP